MAKRLIVPCSGSLYDVFKLQNTFLHHNRCCLLSNDLNTILNSHLLNKKSYSTKPDSNNQNANKKTPKKYNQQLNVNYNNYSIFAAESSLPLNLNNQTAVSISTSNTNLTDKKQDDDQTTNQNSASGNPYPNKKKSDLSESRERFTNLRYFYADPEIDKATDKPLIRLNPMTMLYMGVSDDNSHLLQSANYLRNELPIRLAHMIKKLRSLPFIVACNPSMLDIHERCIKAFRNFDNFDKEIKDINKEKQFNQLVIEMLEMNKDLLALLCDGFKDTRRYIKDEDFIKENLNKILSARLGIRLLCEHHIALNRQSSLNKILLSPEINDEEDQIGSKSNNYDNFNSSYLSSNSGDNNTTIGSSNGISNSNNRDANLVGIIHKKFSPKRLIETSGRLVTRICIDKYGTSPKLKIDGHTNAQFPYLPLPLEYILPELLKNSFRATYENHRNSPSLPDINVTIGVNEKDFVIRIRDRGGGIPHNLKNKIFDYHFSTADSKPDDSNQSQADSESKPFDQSEIFNSSAFGMICEASSSRGLAVMHGYGFGLPTSKTYAEYLGGSLTFQSMQGIGSDFYLRLGRLDVEPEMVRI